MRTHCHEVWNETWKVHFISRISNPTLENLLCALRSKIICHWIKAFEHLKGIQTCIWMNKYCQGCSIVQMGSPHFPKVLDSQHRHHTYGNIMVVYTKTIVERYLNRQMKPVNPLDTVPVPTLNGDTIRAERIVECWKTSDAPGYNKSIWASKRSFRRKSLLRPFCSGWHTRWTPVLFYPSRS